MTTETITGSGLDGVTMVATYYGTVAEAHAYFSNRLHERAWTRAVASKRPKALLAATRIIDALNYKGMKAAEYTLRESVECPTDEQIREANASQELEFPRGSDTDIPLDIRIACYEIAYSLLDGKDAEQEIEALAVTSSGYSSVRTTYNRSQVPIEHLINGVVSSPAWKLIRPYLRDELLVKLSRVS